MYTHKKNTPHFGMAVKIWNGPNTKSYYCLEEKNALLYAYFQLCIIVKQETVTSSLWVTIAFAI